MNKKILLFGLIVIIGTGFYMNGLLNNDDHFQVTSFGTSFDTPNDMVELINSENGTDVFGYNTREQFYYVISFNATENPDLYIKFNDMICKGKKYEENGVLFYEQTNQVLGNNFNVWTGVNLAIKDQTIVGSFIKNDTTGECIVCLSNNWGNVVDTLEDVEWGDKTPITASTIDSTIDEATSEPVYNDTTCKKQLDNADGIGLSDEEYSREHQKEIDAYEKGLIDGGYFDNFEEEEDEEELVSNDASESSAIK